MPRTCCCYLIVMCYAAGSRALHVLTLFDAICYVTGSQAFTRLYSVLVVICYVAGFQASHVLLFPGCDMLRCRLPCLYTLYLIVMCYVAGSQASHLLCLHSVMSRSRLPGLARMLRLGSDPVRGRLSGFARTCFDCDALRRRLPRLACTRCYWR